MSEYLIEALNNMAKAQREMNEILKSQIPKKPETISIAPRTKETEGFKPFEPMLITIRNYAKWNMTIEANGTPLVLNGSPVKGDDICIRLEGLYVGPGFER